MRIKPITIACILLLSLLAASALAAEDLHLISWPTKPLHELSAHFEVKPTKELTAIPFIKPLHQATYDVKPVWEIANRTPVYPLRELKPRVIRIKQIGSVPRAALDLTRDVPGPHNF